MSQPAAQFSRPGAVDLSRLTTQNTTPAAGGSYCVEVTEQSFNQLVAESMQYPLVLLLTSTKDPGSKPMADLLSQLADQAAGRWLLGQIDIDAQPRLAQALQVTAVPTVIAVIAGQAMPLFQGTQDPAQIKAVLDQVVAAAAQSGITGRAKPVSKPAAGDAVDAEPAPRFAAAHEAMSRGDFAAAVTEFDKLLKANPRDTEASAGRASAALLARVGVGDPRQAIALASTEPTNLAAQLAAADAELVLGQPSTAFERLIGLLKVSVGDDREKLRKRILELFETMDQADPELIAARRALGAALY